MAKFFTKNQAWYAYKKRPLSAIKGRIIKANLRGSLTRVKFCHLIVSLSVFIAFF